MIAKGIVEKIYSPNKYAVRIPIFDKSTTDNGRTPTDQLGVAQICTLPNCTPNVRVGDVVFVAFENNDISSPVIIGYMYLDKEYMTRQGISAESIEVVSTAKLPQQTTIGDVSAQEIGYLKGLTANLQSQLMYILEEIDNLKQAINS